MQLHLRHVDTLSLRAVFCTEQDVQMLTHLASRPHPLPHGFREEASELGFMLVQNLDLYGTAQV
jgi:hypothetical protein